MYINAYACSELNWAEPGLACHEFVTLQLQFNIAEGECISANVVITKN